MGPNARDHLFFSPFQHEAEWSDGKWHTGQVGAWDDCWRRDLLPSDKPRFASLFRLLPGLDNYHKAHLKMDSKGRWKHSVEGWGLAVPGVIVVDIDRPTLAEAVADARRLVGRLDSLGVRRESHVAFLSGMKGLHVQFLPESFGPGLLAIGPSPELERAHERAVLLALRAVCDDIVFDTGARETIRLFRTPNSAHDLKASRFKVPITVEELLALDAEALSRLALSPRTGLRTVPSQAEDPALAKLLAEQLEADEERVGRERTALSAMAGRALRRRHPSSKKAMAQAAIDHPAQSSEGLNLPEEARQVLLDRLVALLPARAYLRDAWIGIPLPGKKNSSSEFDFRLAKELFLLGWDRSDVAHAVLLRPGTSSGSKGADYLARTLANANKSAQRIIARRPANRVDATGVAQSASRNGTLRSSWLDRSVLWRSRQGLGPTALRVYYAHVEHAMQAAGFSPEEGAMSQAYFLSRDELLAVANRRTVSRCHELLKAIGLLALVKAGKRGWASEWRVRIPRREDEEMLNEAASRARKAMPSKGNLRAKARRAGRNAARKVIAEWGKGNAGSDHANPGRNPSLGGMESLEWVINRPHCSLGIGEA